MHALRSLLRALVRFFVLWFVSMVAVLVTSRLLPGVNLTAVGNASIWQTAAAVALVLGLANLIVRPLILLLALPLGFIALFVVGFFVNAIMLRLAALLLTPAFEVTSWFAAIVGGVILALATSVLMAILNIDEGTFWDNVIARRLGRQAIDLPPNPTRGLVLLEIDGLSYHHIKKAIADGYMPNVERLIEEHGYVLSRTDCGLPSQTSACQAGILFGDNYDIPAFRWYDKGQNRLFVSGNDAALLNSRYATGNGLLRGGASVNNMLNGDATISLLTASDLRGGTDEQKRARARDVYTLLLNPNFFMRVIALVIGEALLEVWQYGRDVITGVQPRLNRLHKAYPFVRAATTVFMREVSGFLTLLQIGRGEPAMYTTWPGYDEVAHHSGPWSKYAFATLRGYDSFLGTVLEMVEKAPRPYEVLLLSDHGQSFGPTFLQRYGYTLKEFILKHMPVGTVVHETAGGDDGSLSVISVAAELGNIRQEGMGGRVGQAATKQMEKAAQGVAKRTQDAGGDQQPADVTFCGSGNLAQVYFHAFPARTSVSDLNAAYPGMLDAVVGHEGVGLVVVADDAGVPIVFSKAGARNLHSGEVSGDDPLVPYGDVDVRAWQLRRVADFPAAGDMLVISTVYPDGSVAAMEELIGNHGGMGGEQTDSFLLHPADLTLPPIRNAYELFDVLNARRDLPAPAPAPTPERTPAADDWSPRKLGQGLSRVGEWASLAVRAAVLDRAAYREIAARGDMTGPALLLGLLGAAGVAAAGRNFTTLPGYLVQVAVTFLFWLVATGLMYGAALILRGKGSYTQTLRVMGFVQTLSLLNWLSLIPGLDTIIPTVISLVTIIGTWLGVSEAHQIRGWRTLLLPFLYLAIIIAGFVGLITLAGGVNVTIQELLARFGLR